MEYDVPDQQLSSVRAGRYRPEGTEETCCLGLNILTCYTFIWIDCSSFDFVTPAQEGPTTTKSRSQGCPRRQRIYKEENKECNIWEKKSQTAL